MILLLPLALAYETDQLTERDVPLQDVREAANARVDAILAEAIVTANVNPGCGATDTELRAALAREVHLLTSKDTYIPGRRLAGLGYGRFAAWMETTLPDLRSFSDRRDIYGAVGPGQSLVLDEVGPCSTFNLGGVLMGSDKPDHFFDEGYFYALRSKWGKREARAIRWGTFTELSFYGMLTSAVFSYADLAANHAGYRFYVGLLREGSVVLRGEDGCAYPSRPFDWAEWVDPSWDEVSNPSVYPRRVQERVEEHLRAHRDSYCASYARWGDGYSEALYPMLQDDPAYASSKAPTRVDPFQLDHLCYGWTTRTAATDGAVED